MPTSNTEPEIIQLDYVKNGQALILVHWDIEPFEREEQTGYTYQECRMWWVLPKSYSTRAGVKSYLTSVQSEILNWAQGSKVTL